MKRVTHINIPEKCLVLLIGASSAGKSTFARAHFKPTEIISSDYCRAMVADSEQVLDANDATFEVLHLIVRKRLERGLLTVVDATNLEAEGREGLVRIARECHLHTYAIVMNPPLAVLEARNELRIDRQLPNRILKHHHRRVRQSIRHLTKEGIRYFFEITADTPVNETAVTRTPMPSDLKHLTGPFDIIGDVHGCQEELLELLTKLEYSIEQHEDRELNYGYTVTPPAGRMACFVGDLVDRGPASNEVLRLVMSMVETGTALCVIGNHDDKLRRYLAGRNVTVAHGLAETIAQLETETADFRKAVLRFLRQLPYHVQLDNNELLVAHAGLQESMHGRVGGAVRSYCLYGETSGKLDENNLPERYPWAQDYQGKTKIVYGHTPTNKPQWFNRTLCLDTGCVFGGELMALRYPENKIITVVAKATYAESKRPPAEGSPSAIDVLNADDVIGRQTIHTPLIPNVLINRGQSLAALETMSRFAADPRQLIYLPPTMSPVATSKLDGFLEHPAEAFAYYRDRGISKVVCEEKHMGSRTIIVVGKNAESISTRFGIKKGMGWILTRTGRPFFQDKQVEAELLQRLKRQLDKTEFWSRHQTDWLLLDAELMPWSAKAKGLLEQQYAATAAAGSLAMQHARAAVAQAQQRGIELGDLGERLQTREQNLNQFRAAYHPYCWEVTDTNDLRLAPFHILATEGKVHTDKDHAWHLDELSRFCEQEQPTLMMTRYRWVDLNDEAAVTEATNWWLELTAKGGEGMVIKPEQFIAHHKGKLLQPALKVRGQEYLRLIYGPDYTLPENLTRLRKRALGKKRSLAEREFALGIEALERFVQREALTKVHQCVFAILALESEEVDGTL